MIFAKYNSIRKRTFQIETSIFVTSEGQKRVKKRAINTESLSHIERIISGYNSLKENIKDNKLILPEIVETTVDSITYKFIDGESLNSSLFNAFIANKKSLFKELLRDYYVLLTNSFTLSKKLEISDKESFLFENIDMSFINDEKIFIKQANADPIFSNLILSDKATYIIDHEWVFESSLPLKFIFVRALVFNFYNVYWTYGINNFIPLEELLDEYDVSQEQLREFEKVEENFQKFTRNKVEVNRRYAKGFTRFSEIQEEVVALKHELNLLPHRLVGYFINMLRRFDPFMHFYEKIKRL